MAVIGVDVGGTKIAAARVAPDGAIEALLRRPTPGDGERLLSDVVDLVRELAGGSEPPTVGVGIAAQMDRRGRVVSSTHLDLDGVDVAGELRERLGRPVELDNDANAAVLAEAWTGAARGARSVLMLTLGTGVGGGVVVGGRIFRGGVATGGELGHVVVDADGPPCFGGCPGRGCLEALASGTAVGRFAREAAERAPGGSLAAAAAAGPLDAVAVGRMAADGDEEAASLFGRAGRFLGVGIASLANIFAPEIVVVGGGMSAVGELILGPARAEYVRRALPPNAGARIVRAALGGDAGVVGAAMLAVRERT